MSWAGEDSHTCAKRVISNSTPETRHGVALYLLSLPILTRQGSILRIITPAFQRNHHISSSAAGE